jgi:dTDP-4-amino-4,6-dideoxygalactose transaminase
VIEVLEERYGASAVLLTDSGTSALRLAIAGATAGSDRPVALPGYGCYDLSTAAEGAGAQVVLYDLDSRNLGPDPTSLDRVRAVNPAAVVVTHLFGYPADMRPVREAFPQAVLIEDAAQGAGGSLGGRPLGALGSVSVLSFGRGKGMTGGGGGALLGLDDVGIHIVERARETVGPAGGRGFKQLLALTAQRVLGRPSLYGIPSRLPFLHLGETVYHPPQAPQAPTIASLAVLEQMMPEGDSEVELRRRHAVRLEGLVARSSRVQAVETLPGARPGYLRLPVLLPGDPDPTHALRAATDLGVTGMYPTTLDSLPSLAPLRVGPDIPISNAESLTRTLAVLPTHRLLSPSDLDALEAWLAVA